MFLQLSSLYHLYFPRVNNHLFDFFNHADTPCLCFQWFFCIFDKYAQGPHCQNHWRTFSLLVLLWAYFFVLFFKPLLSNLIEHVLQYLFRCCWWYVSMLTISQWLTFLLKRHTNSIWYFSECIKRKLKVKNYKLCWGRPG